jgi:diaminohydroxyphosphoribosylaminopyrimidine deaminase/5-amino-6-(5-phosphoribosylamino)uracil reductase
VGDAPLIVFGSADEFPERAAALRRLGVEVINEPGRCRDLNAVFSVLNKARIQSVLVEGGGTIAAAFLEARVVDKVSFFLAPVIIGGQSAPGAVGGGGASRLLDAVRLTDVSFAQFGSDFEFTGYPRYGSDGAPSVG